MVAALVEPCAVVIEALPVAPQRSKARPRTLIASTQRRSWRWTRTPAQRAPSFDRPPDAAASPKTATRTPCCVTPAANILTDRSRERDPAPRRTQLDGLPRRGPLAKDDWHRQAGAHTATRRVDEPCLLRGRRENRANTQPTLLWGRGVAAPEPRRRAARKSSWPGPRSQAPSRRPPQWQLSLGAQGETSTRFQSTKI
jgi:hypothetical protein